MMRLGILTTSKFILGKTNFFNIHSLFKKNSSNHLRYTCNIADHLSRKNKWVDNMKIQVNMPLKTRARYLPQRG